MKSRREFLFRSAALVGAFGLGSLKAFALENKIPIGIQLYTLRNELDKDPIGTLEAISKQGYTILEGFATKKGYYFGLDVSKYKGLIDKLGMRQVSMHVPLNSENAELPTLTNKLEVLIKDAKILGIEYLVCPWIDSKQRETTTNWIEIADKLNEVGEKLKENGIKLAYHNHDFEFKSVDGEIPYELLLKRCNPKFVSFELDLYWASKVEKSPVDLFKQNPERFVMWHVKDMDSNGKITEVGNGKIDFKSIFALAKLSGMQYFFIEQDTPTKNTVLESTKISINYTRKTLVP